MAMTSVLLPGTFARDGSRCHEKSDLISFFTGGNTGS